MTRVPHQTPCPDLRNVCAASARRREPVLAKSPGASTTWILHDEDIAKQQKPEMTR